MFKKMIAILLTLLMLLTLSACSIPQRIEAPQVPEILETPRTEDTEPLPTEAMKGFESADEEMYLLCDTPLYESPREDAEQTASQTWGDPVHRVGVSREGWSALESGKGTAYVKTAFLSQNPPGKLDNDLYVTENATLTEAPDAEAKPVGKLLKGSKITDVRGSVSGWYLVRYKGKTGFLPAESTSMTAPGEDGTESTTVAPPVEEGDVVFTSVGRQTVYTIDSVNYRTGPGTEYQLLGEIPAHAQFIRIAEGSNGWDKVIYRGIECCVAGNYLTTQRPSNVVETELPAPEPQKPAQKPEAVAPDGHTHVYEDQIIPPTCIAEGYTNHACSCGEQYADTFVPPLGHDWGDWQESIPATKDGPGEEICVCSRCQAAKSREIPQLPADACEHQWEASGKEPTELSLDGMIATMERELKCALCGETRTETYQEVSQQAVSGAISQLFTETNALREANGLPAFAPASAQWNEWANLRAKEQAQRQGHTRPDGSSWVTSFGDESTGAENVALTSAGNDPDLGRAFYELYLNSPGHKANMLSDNQKLALGIYVDPESHIAYNAMVIIRSEG